MTTDNHEVAEYRDNMALACLKHSENPVIRGAFAILDRITGYRRRVREFFYAVMLFQKQCPECHRATLVMLRDSWCRCRSCGHEVDPTITFQTCPACGTALTKKIFHYWCPACRAPVTSQFCFDAKVFDKTYFREMMRESREKKRRKREEIRQMLQTCRSAEYTYESAVELTDLPGLDLALDSFVGLPLPGEVLAQFVQRPEFDMHQYRAHILRLVSGCVVHFDGIMPLIPDRRLDRIFRFITLIFLDHEGLVSLTQAGGEILVSENETHGEGQGFLGQAAATC